VAGEPVLLRACGELSAVRDGTELRGRALGSAKGRRLLARLVADRGRLVSTDRLVESLWPDESPADPAGGVATLVSRLRHVLGPGVVSGSRAAYGLRRGEAWTTDLDQARALVEEASARVAGQEPGLGGAAAERALGLLGSHQGLDDLDPDDWVLGLREEVRGLRSRATHLAAVSATAVGRADRARELAAAAFRTDPLDEVAARDLMAAHAAAGESAQALTVYAALARSLRRELGTDPARETQDLHLLLLRGRAQASAAAPVVPRRTEDLLGRGEELGVLTGAWEQAARGTGALVVVAGVGGSGKTRLVAELCALARRTGGLVAAARCHASERSLFLQPVVDALRPTLASMSTADLQEAVAGHERSWLTLLPDLATVVTPPASSDQPGALPAEVEQRLAFDAVATGLARLAARRPVLLVLDDLQDAGLATGQLLDHLSRRVPAHRVLLVGATRNAADLAAVVDLDAPRCSVLTVGPLPASAVRAMAAAAGQADSAGVLLERTRGHALTVVEMLRALAEGERGVPPTLAAAVLQRVARAGKSAGSVLHAASVLGPRVEPPLLAGLLARPELEVVRDCEVLVPPALLVRTQAGYEFANDVVQEVVYANLPAALRAAHHRRAADLLAARPEEMARHAEAAGDDERAARGWLLAGRQAIVGGAAADAVGLLERALAAARRSAATDLEVRALLGRARAMEALTEYTEAINDIDAALLRATETGDRRLELAALRARGGDVPVALHHPASSWGGYLSRGLALAAELGDRQIAAELGARLAVLSTSGLRFDEAEEYAERAVAAGRASGDDRALAAGLDGLKTVRAYLGDGPGLEAVLDELLPLVRRAGDAWVLQWCVFEGSFVPMSRGAADEARRQVAAAEEANARSGFPAYAPFFRAHAARFARLAGDLTTAVDEGRRALVAAERRPHPWWVAAAAGLLGTTLLDVGEPAEAADVARRGWEQVAALEGDEAYQLLTLGPLAAATGERDVVAAAARRLAAVRTPPGQAWLLGADAYLTTARALRDAGDAPAALAAVAPLLEATSPSRWAAVHTAATELRRSVRAG
jgi:DNA-binding SARP family transcriptional activator/tetratricopeptide (TPR) repeat protein